MSRRQVRVDPTFFDRLDELLAPERGSDGTPSTTDFLLHDLPVVIDLLAEDYFGHTTVVAADPEIRVSITAGLLVPFISVYAVRGEDDVVEIIYLDLG